MAKKIDIYQIDAFTDEPFKGNPAGVVISDDLSPGEMQLIAGEMNLSETAFIGKSDTADYKLRWFTPLREVDLCGHATIASLHLLYTRKLISEDRNITFETRSGKLNCFVSDGRYYMQIPVRELSEYNGCREEITGVLGINPTDVSELPFILLDNGYLFIKINSLNALKNLKPDFNLLKEISDRKKDFFDTAVFTDETIDKGSSAHLRFFAPYHGINEDPVTGSACGPLLPVLIRLGILNEYKDNQLIIFEQGDFLNRKGRVYVQFDSVKNQLYISGTAITVLKGKIRL